MEKEKTYFGYDRESIKNNWQDLIYTLYLSDLTSEEANLVLAAICFDKANQIELGDGIIIKLIKKEEDSECPHLSFMAQESFMDSEGITTTPIALVSRLSSSECANNSLRYQSSGDDPLILSGLFKLIHAYEIIEESN